MQQLLFSLFPSILIFDFDLILGLFLTFWGPNGPFSGSIWGSKTVLASAHVVEEISFSMIPSILIFDFDLVVFDFLGLQWAVFGGRSRIRKLFWGLLMKLKNFHFL